MSNHGALLHGGDFSGMNLSGSIFNHENDSLDAVGWEESTWTGAYFHYLDLPYFPDGMVHHEYGIVIVPEPETLRILALGMMMTWGR